MSSYRLVSINDDEDTCARCGRTNLAKVVWLAELDGDGNIGDVRPYGVDCAARLLHKPQKAVAALVESFDHRKERAIAQIRATHPNTSERDELAAAIAFLRARGRSLAKIQASPQYCRWQRLTEEAQAWAEAQFKGIEV